jgi:hypothetical protein
MMATQGAGSGKPVMSSRLAGMSFMRKQQRPDAAAEQAGSRRNYDAAGPGPSSTGAADLVKQTVQLSVGMQNMPFMQKNKAKRKFEEAIENPEKEQEEVSTRSRVIWPLVASVLCSAHQ